MEVAYRKKLDGLEYGLQQGHYGCVAVAGFPTVKTLRERGIGVVVDLGIPAQFT